MILRRTLGPSRIPGAHIRGPTVRLSWPLFLAGMAGTALLWTVVKAVTHPRTTASLAAAGAVTWAGFRHGWYWVAAGALVVGALAASWHTWHPSTFDRWIACPAVARWRLLAVYRRQWQPAMVTTGLSLPSAMGNLLPVLERVRHRPGLDIVRVRLNPGQDLTDWTRVAGRLARVFDVAEVRPRTVPDQPDRLDLWCLVRDPLDRPVPPFTPAGPVDLEAVPVAVTENGDVFTLPVLGSHLLVAGETGSGKGSVLWSVLAGLEPAILEGTVRVWALDPKGGMELQPGAHLFARFEYRDPQAMAAVLDQAVAALRQRTENLRAAGLRRVTPTPDLPLLVLVVDELAALVAYVSDAALRRRITDALSLLLSQGRAPGVAVIAATQDARKETLGMRDLFPRRVALRTAEAGQADMILGEGARGRGALTDRIPHRLPGVGYVHAEGQDQPARVRFSYLSDEDLAGLGRPAVLEGVA